jgi:hypothetical protein
VNEYDAISTIINISDGKNARINKNNPGSDVSMTGPIKTIIDRILDQNYKELAKEVSIRLDSEID